MVGVTRPATRPARAVPRPRPSRAPAPRNEVVLPDADGGLAVGGPTREEADRLQALYRSRVLDTEAEQAFDDLVLLAAHVCGVRSAAITFLDADREWVKASVGSLPARVVDDGLQEHERSPAVLSLAATLGADGALVVTDLRRDPRTRDHPVVVERGLRFYAGVPVRTRTGHVLGTVSVLDTTPRRVTAAQVGALSAVARQVAVLLEWRQLRPTLSTYLSARRGS